MKHWRLARDSLEQSFDVFEGMGGSQWARLARREAARIGGRPPTPTTLTETERRVAQLIATGLTVREVASRLFLSEKSIEANLSKIYRKLRIRSRAELGALMARQNRPGTNGGLGARWQARTRTSMASNKPQWNVRSK